MVSRVSSWNHDSINEFCINFLYCQVSSDRHPVDTGVDALIEAGHVRPASGCECERPEHPLVCGLVEANDQYVCSFLLESDLRIVNFDVFVEGTHQ